jgi:lipopolysaccharide biosynthesis glycosyltransferase
MPNGGLQVVNPSLDIYNMISEAMNDSKIMDYDFADQSLLGDVFSGRWVALPYIYNALKTLRWGGVHNEIWQDASVKNVHYILSPKPWDESAEDRKKAGRDPTHAWWWMSTEERRELEKQQRIDDGF